MNWKLIFLLSMFGLLDRYLTLQKGLIAEWVWILLFLIVIPGSCAGWIVQKAPGKYFLHGFWTGVFINLFSALLLLVVVLGGGTIYSATIGPVFVRYGFFGVPIGATSYGLYIGLFASVGSKIARKAKAYKGSE